MRAAIEWARKIPGSEGAVIKAADTPYFNREWIKFRNLSDIDVVVIEKIPRKRGVYGYLVGIYVPESAVSKLNPKKLTELNGKPVLVLGKTFNTDLEFNVGDIISILVEEVWRHHTRDGIHYSIHKPHVAHITEKKNTSSLTDLDEIVTSVGVAVKEMSKEPKDEGTERENIRDFPKRMQKSFEKIMKNKLWMPFVVQLHTIGRKAHRDFRFFIPKKDYGKVLTYDDAYDLYLKGKLDGYLEGITLFEPSTVEDPNLNADSHVRGTIKVPQPVDWLFFEGITHKVGTAGTRYPGVFTIISRGIYTIEKVGDHLIRFIMLSDDGKINKKILKIAKEKEKVPVYEHMPDKYIKLRGNYSYHIAHIEKDKWIMLFDKLKHYTRITPKEIVNISLMLQGDFSVPEIARFVNVSTATVRKYRQIFQ